MEQLFHTYIIELSILAGIIVWGIRLEGKIQVQADLMTKLSEIAERLSYIEGTLKNDHR